MKRLQFSPEKATTIHKSPVGTGWQTRRVIQPQPGPTAELFEWEGSGTYRANGLITDCAMGPWKPRFKVGDLVAITEPWRALAEFDHLQPKDIPIGFPIYFDGSDQAWIAASCDVGKARSARFMPASMSRTTGKIIGVRAERLIGISYEDAMAEGILGPFPGPHRTTLFKVPGDADPNRGWLSPRFAYEYMWDSANAKRGFPWAGNYWVFVYEFERGE